MDVHQATEQAFENGKRHGRRQAYQFMKKAIASVRELCEAKGYADDPDTWEIVETAVEEITESDLAGW